MLFFLLFIIVLLIVLGGFMYKSWVIDDNIKDNIAKYELKIRSGSSFSDVLYLLKKDNVLKNYDSFEFLAGLMKYKRDNVPPGRYIIKGDMGNRQIISTLRAGLQEPVNITFNNVRTIEELIGKIANYIEPDSTEIANYIQEENYLAKFGYNKYTILSLFIPNTYEFFWNTPPQKFISRMKSEHDKFWKKNNRLEKAKKLGLTEKEVFTLASIVQKETLVADEKPIVSSVYLNRLKINMLLQADPTVVYASGNFGLKRVLNKHLEINSPYNTYKNPGLPIGPICMPDVSTIDAVLNTKDTKYLYFCAKPEGGGRHAFATNLRQHNNNANKYRRYLNKRNL